MFDREKVFIETVLKPLIERLPKLKVVMEHITTANAAKFVLSCEHGIYTSLFSLKCFVSYPSFVLSSIGIIFYCQLCLPIYDF